MKPEHVRSIRTRSLAIFNLAVDSKLRACDLLHLLVQTVQFEIMERSSSSIEAWRPMVRATNSQYLFTSDFMQFQSTRQYARLVHCWFKSTALESVVMAHTRCRVRGSTDIPQKPAAIFAQ
jgi:hypothetical protein